MKRTPTRIHPDTATPCPYNDVLTSSRIFSTPLRRVAVVAMLACAALFSYARVESRLDLGADGQATLMVDGAPFIIVGGETGNSMGSCPADVDAVMADAVAHGYNTVLIPAAWELIEPQKGKFDFSSVDTIISSAESKGLKVVLLWFGAWKNSMSCYTPAWFKADSDTYPRARTRSGKPLEIASAFSPEVYEADSRAFTALLRHIAETDTAGTVIMLQIENEIGMLEEARDYSQPAQKAYAKGVPAALMAHIKKNTRSLHPSLLARWKENGMKSSGPWFEVFGDDIYTDEMFMAWAYASYVEALAREARMVFPTMPLYVNAAMNSRGRRPGEYPSAGPLIHLKDIWHAAAPSVDFLSPDLYDKGFTSWVDAYATPDNTLFIPEIKTAPENPVQALYVVGEKGAIGMSPFAYNLRGDASSQRPGNLMLRSLTPLVTAPGAKARMNGLYFDADSVTRTLVRDGLRIKASHYFTLPWDPRATDGSVWPVTGGLIMQTAPMEYIIAGKGMVLTFEPETASETAAQNLGEDGFLNAGADRRSAAPAKKWRGKRIGLAAVEEVTVNPDGSLTRVRTFNGDETHQGRHVRIGVDDYKILHVKLYEYE